MNLATVKVERVRVLTKESNVKAFCDIIIGGSFVVKGLRVVKGKKGLFVGLPREKGKEDKYYDIFYPVSKEAREELETAVIEAYNAEVAKEVK